MRSFRRLARPLVAGAIVLSATAASGHPSDYFQPFAANDYLCTSTRCTQNVTSTGVQIIDRGNLVGFWQNILRSDGYASVCTSNGIDGFYGSRSESNTKAWQAAFDLAKVDGIVGPQTWTAAERFVAFSGIDGLVIYERYQGALNDFYLLHPLTHGFAMYWEYPTGIVADGPIGSGHPEISFSGC